jgi:microsomal dipeptidase-like Zn-dependent dipeptidase
MIFLIFVSYFLPIKTQFKMTFFLSAHINHIRKIAGVDYIGLGGDYNGITE